VGRGAIAADLNDSSPPVANLSADTALAAPVSAKEKNLAQVFGSAAVKTGRAFVALGRIQLPKEQLAGLDGKSVQQLLEAVAERSGSRWRKYRDFYLLYPQDMERHSATPVRRDKVYPELDKKIVGTFEGQVLSLALQRLGAGQRLQLIVLGIGSTPSGFKRNLLPTIIAAEGKHVEELCWALTRALGDPWERIGSAHALVLAGRSLTAEEKRKSMSAGAIAQFGAGLSFAQQQQLLTPEGLTPAQMTPLQRQWLALATSDIRGHAGGVGADQLVLRRLNANNNAVSDDIDVYALDPGGLRSIGSIVAPAPARREDHLHQDPVGGRPEER
jgi:hypothetical protein